MSGDEEEEDDDEEERWISAVWEGKFGMEMLQKHGVVEGWIRESVDEFVGDGRFKANESIVRRTKGQGSIVVVVVVWKHENYVMIYVCIRIYGVEKDAMSFIVWWFCFVEWKWLNENMRLMHGVIYSLFNY